MSSTLRFPPLIFAFTKNLSPSFMPHDDKERWWPRVGKGRCWRRPLHLQTPLKGKCHRSYCQFLCSSHPSVFLLHIFSSFILFASSPYSTTWFTEALPILGCSFYRYCWNNVTILPCLNLLKVCLNSSIMRVIYFNLDLNEFHIIFTFSFSGAAAQRGPRPPHSWGF